MCAACAAAGTSFAPLGALLIPSTVRAVVASLTGLPPEERGALSSEFRRRRELHHFAVASTLFSTCLLRVDWSISTSVGLLNSWLFISVSGRGISLLLLVLFSLDFSSFLGFVISSLLTLYFQDIIERFKDGLEIRGLFQSDSHARLRTGANATDCTVVVANKNIDNSGGSIDRFLALSSNLNIIILVLTQDLFGESHIEAE